MAQSRRLFEGAALAAALAVGHAASAQQGGSQPPKGADYPTAVQCAGLHSALAVFSPKDAARNDARHAERFEEWAKIRAPEVNKSAAMATADIDTARKNFLRDAGRGQNATRWRRLVDRYNYQWNACRLLSDVQEYTAVDG
jgi:hypothetical protein